MRLRRAEKQTTSWPEAAQEVAQERRSGATQGATTRGAKQRATTRGVERGATGSSLQRGPYCRG